MTPRTLPSVGRSTKWDTHHNSRPSPRRHSALGRLDVKELQLRQRDSSLYTPSTLRGENRAQKHINNPHVQGARTQDIQHDAGHPNSPTIHQVHASGTLGLEQRSGGQSHLGQMQLNPQNRDYGETSDSDMSVDSRGSWRMVESKKKRKPKTKTKRM